MAPQHREKRTSSSPAVATMPSTTPQRSPVRKRRTMITQRQKQALIDNLQLEITERARKLRAQYALQAHSLRTRVELRVNRIPKNLRSAKMGDLLLKCAESTQEEEKATARQTVQPAHTDAMRKGTTANEPKAMTATATQSRGTKRTSDTMIAADKENTPDATQPFPNPKKRTKTTAAVQSRQITNPSCVLSPKSSNSRTLPQSPIRPPLDSRQKPHFSHPTSPLKPASPIKMAPPAKSAVLAATTTLANIAGEKPKAGRVLAATGRKASKPVVVEPKATAARPKRGAPTGPTPTETRTVSSSSNTSATSTGTTVVKSKAKVPPAAKAPTRKGVGVSTVGKKVARAKVEAPATGRRVLRTRA